jgi:hypothetical protein
MAAFLRVPNMYTSACDMKRPTVMPMVTAIIAAPMSMPFPDAVMPPACESPDCVTRQREGSERANDGGA